MFFLHGFMGSVKDFDFLPTNFIGLEYVNASGIDVLEKPWDEISSHLWEQVSDEKISLFGYSMGGRIALAMFAAQPDRVEKLVLCGAQFCPPVEQKNILPLPQRGQEEARISRKIIDEERAIFLRDQPDDFLDWWSTLELFGPQKSTAWSLVKERRATRMKTLAPTWANLLRALSVSEQPDFSTLIKEHAQKIIFIYGANDEKYADFAKAYRKLGVQTIAVPDAWHAVHLDEPDYLASILNRIS